jgi:hypothetical protein
MSNLIEVILISIWQMLPAMGAIIFVSGIIGSVHKESWEDILYFSESIKWGLYGFLICVALFLFPLLIWGWTW